MKCDRCKSPDCNLLPIFNIIPVFTCVTCHRAMLLEYGTWEETIAFDTAMFQQNLLTEWHKQMRGNGFTLADAGNEFREAFVRGCEARTALARRILAFYTIPEKPERTLPLMPNRIGPRMQG